MKAKIEAFKEERRKSKLAKIASAIENAPLEVHESGATLDADVLDMMETSTGEDAILGDGKGGPMDTGP